MTSQTTAKASASPAPGEIEEDVTLRDAIVIGWHGQRITPLVSAILPEVIELQRQHPEVYLERHWIGGPHLALIAPPASGAQPSHAPLDSVRDRIEATVGRLPQGPELTESEWNHLATTRGRAELIEPPYGHLRADGSVHREQYRLRSVELVGHEAYPIKERFLARSLSAVRASLERGDRMGSALRLLALHGSRWPLGGLEVGQLTYRSHLEDYLHLRDAAAAQRGDRGPSARAALAAATEPHAPAARRLVATLLEEAPDGRYVGTDPLLRQWSGVLDGVWPLATQAAADGIIGYEPGAEYADRAGRLGEAERRRWGYGEDRTYSNYHQHQRALSTLPEPVAAQEFSAYRFLTNQAYRTLPLLDITSTQRYVLCALLADAVEAVTGTTWQDLMREAAANADQMLNEGAQS